MSVDVSQLSEQQREDITQALDAVDALRALNSGTIEQIEKIERQITYRRFYFYGQEVKLHLDGEPGLNVQVPDDVVYIKDNWNMSFDPRYLPDYIEAAKQYQFYKHVIRFDPYSGKFVSSSFYDVNDLLSKDILIGNTNDKSKYLSVPATVTDDAKTKIRDELIGVIASMEYFGKWESFLKEFDDYTKNEIEMIRKYYKATYNSKIKQIAELTGQSINEFKELDYGYFADQNLAFDSAKYIGELEKYEVQYNEYKKKLWDILSNCNSLSLAGNRVSGTFVVSGESQINITQTNEMLQAYKEALDEEAAAPATPTPSAPASKLAPSAPATPASKLVPSEPTSEPTPATPTPSPTPVPSKPSNEPVPQTQKENRFEITPLLVVIVVFTVLLIGVVILFIAVWHKARAVHVQSAHVLATAPASS